MSRSPVIYEIDTRVWLRELSLRRERELSLAEVPDEEIESIAGTGAGLVWLMGVWQTGRKSLEEAQKHPGLRAEYRSALADFVEDDIIGSPYAIADYVVSPALGGEEGLAALRRRLAEKGLGLILDFVPNHTGRDHPWIAEHPEFFVQGDEDDIAREPGNFFRAVTRGGDEIIAHGRDPYFPGWTDTAQLNYLSPKARSSLLDLLEAIAECCDGVRCDMAMLVLEDVFRRTWGERPLRSGGEPAGGEFWSEAIARVRQRRPQFLFIAEAYWGLERRLQELGFDYTYDKTLYDRLRHGGGAAVRAHLEAPLAFAERCVRFLENHDEARAASAFSWPRHRAAALAISTLPGMMLLFEGQLEGRQVKLPIQLRRRPRESPDPEVRAFYERLLGAVRNGALRQGGWRLIPLEPAWEGNPSWESFLVWERSSSAGGRRLIAINFSESRGQCYARIGEEAYRGRVIELADRLGDARYLRSGTELIDKGLYLDLEAFGMHLFDIHVRTS
jgi:hypothetical protein